MLALRHPTGCLDLGDYAAPRTALPTLLSLAALRCMFNMAGLLVAAGCRLRFLIAPAFLSFSCANDMREMSLTVGAKHLRSRCNSAGRTVARWASAAPMCKQPSFPLQGFARRTPAVQRTQINST